MAVILSVTITLVMEGSSQKAFAMLNNIYDNLVVRVIRDGQILTVSQKEIGRSRMKKQEKNTGRNESIEYSYSMNSFTPGTRFSLAKISRVLSRSQ